jgi:type II secretory pathway pseudopilin PulG
MKFLNQRGYSLIEIGVALGIMLVGIFVITRGMDSMREITEDTLTLSANERQINMIADNLRTGLEQYQINFDQSDKRLEEILKVDTLPMAWDVGKNGPAENCPTCKGRYGYSIQVLERYRGLFLVTLRVTHKDWSEPFRDYKFVVTVK